MPSTYILKDDTEKIYIGSCVSLDKRYNDHLNHNTRTTKNFVNPKIIWNKEFETLKDARACEKKIKKWKSRKMVELLIESKVEV